VSWENFPSCQARDCIAHGPKHGPQTCLLCARPFGWPVRLRARLRAADAATCRAGRLAFRALCSQEVGTTHWKKYKERKVPGWCAMTLSTIHPAADPHLLKYFANFASDFKKSVPRK